MRSAGAMMAGRGIGGIGFIRWWGACLEAPNPRLTRRVCHRLPVPNIPTLQNRRLSPGLHDASTKGRRPGGGEGLPAGSSGR